MVQNNSFDIGRSSFWIIMVAIAIIYLAWLGIYSFQTPSVGIRGIVVSSLFTLMILSTLVVTNNAPFKTKASFGSNSAWWIGGAVVWGTVRAITLANDTTLSVFT